MHYRVTLPVLLLLALGALAVPANLPQIKAQTLSGKHAVLPDDASGRVALLVFGFTHSSKPAILAWTKKVGEEFADDQNFVLYDVAVVQDIPRLLRGLAEHGMRSDVPAAQHDRFLLLKTDEQAWKKFVGYQQPADAYLVLLDRSGEVRDQWHGPFSISEDQKLAEEAQQLEK
ncbi:MAG TPA: hypothetical protein VGR48_07115 [Terriglobales bacterium]|nr:hypothetical protein [Terriglobales bacterium]